MNSLHRTKQDNRTKIVQSIKTKNRKHFQIKRLRFTTAEREGFEPPIHFWRIHTFQACSFNHSDTSPFYWDAKIHNNF